MTAAATKVTGIIAALVMFISGCASNTEPPAGGNEQNPTSTTESEINMQENITFVPDETNVKLIGRTANDSGILWLALSASGFEFTFTGTSASITLVGDSVVANGPDKQARFAVYIDGEQTLDTQLDAAEKTYEIFSSDAAKQTTVKLLKLSESAESTIGVKAVNVTGGEVAPTAEKELKIEFIGDSITCGYGVDDEVKEHGFSTSTEDATKAYAYKTAQLLDADYSLVSYSGHGIISAYTGDGKKNTSGLVPPIYEQFAKSYGSYDGIFNVSMIDWDFSRFQPDMVVINLGTNDASYCGSQQDRIDEYSAAYAEFLKTVRKNNPDAHILCVLGVMGDSLYKGVEKAVEIYSTETGDTKVSSLRLTPQNGSTGFAADWHPTAATHDIAASETAAEIKSILGIQ